ncbi:hypothetical protein GCM10010394_37520 [Streptomyces crystallinus]|uniref:Uncharacterized protein n=1 Tax=Streptomyces crystallinus TaxID=68191 RepID=A0ABP3RBK5_9ACTN
MSPPYGGEAQGGKKETPRYRVAVRPGEYRAGAGARTSACARQKLTYVLTVPTEVTARDRERAGYRGVRG